MHAVRGVAMRVVPIPCLTDNYAYLVVCEQTGKAAVVDPSEAEPVLTQVQALQLELVAILNTHHHWDHVGGNEHLCAHHPHLRVYGHASDGGRIPCQNVFLEATDTLLIGSLSGTLTHNPGHTRGAISYYFEDAAFTGDTLFGSGCGRLFEGDAQDMYRSLQDQIGRRPPSTRVFFGHEYTESNLRFALSLEPDNGTIQARYEQVRQSRAQGLPTCPSTLADEFATNPFMRCDQPRIIAAAKAAESGCGGDPVSVLSVIRRLKDQFRS